MNNNSIVSYTASVNSTHPDVKQKLADYFIRGKLYAKIERKRKDVTQFTVQGHGSQFPNCLQVLQGLLLSEGEVALVWDGPFAVDEKSILNSVIIENTDPTMKRSESSGEFRQVEIPLDEVSFGSSASTKYLKENMMQFAHSILNAGTTAGLTEIKQTEKNDILFEYKGKQKIVDTSKFVSLSSLIQELDRRFGVATPIGTLYFYTVNGRKCVVDELSDLKPGNHVCYALSVNDKVNDYQFCPSFRERMEKLFELLKNEEGIKDVDVSLVKDIFEQQRITFNLLIVNGNIKVTEDELKEWGIQQAGIRKNLLIALEHSILDDHEDIADLYLK